MSGAAAHYRSALNLEPAYPDGQCRHYQHYHRQDLCREYCYIYRLIRFGTTADTKLLSQGRHSEEKLLNRYITKCKMIIAKPNKNFSFSVPQRGQQGRAAPWWRLLQVGYLGNMES